MNKQSNKKSTVLDLASDLKIRSFEVLKIQGFEVLEALDKGFESKFLRAACIRTLNSCYAFEKAN